MANKKKKANVQSAVDKVASRIKSELSDSGPGGGRKQRKRKANNGGGGGSGQGLGIVNASDNKVSLATRFSMRNSGSEGDITISGSEVVGLTQPVNAGLLNFVLDLNPMSWTGTRVAQMAKLFEKYRFDSATLTYIPSVGSTTAGLQYAYYDRDVADAPISGVDVASNISRMMGNQRAVVGQIWRPLVLKYNKTPQEGTYFINPVQEGPDQRTTTQAIVYMYQSVVSTSSTGIIKVDYNLSLYTPTGPLLSGTGVVSAPGWIRGTITLAATASGSAVPASSPDFASLTSASTAVFEWLPEATIPGTSIQFGLNMSATSAIARYAPLFIRYINGAYRLYDTFGEAVSGNQNSFAFAGSGLGSALVTPGWLKIATVIANELYGDAST